MATSENQSGNLHTDSDSGKMKIISFHFYSINFSIEWFLQNTKRWNIFPFVEKVHGIGILFY